MGFLGWLGNLLTGGLADKVLGAWQEHERAKMAAMNDAERRAAEERADVRATAKEIRLATAGHWEMRLITALIAGTFTLHLLLVGLDTCFALGLRIAKFPAPFDEWEGAILLSFFGVQIADRVSARVTAASVIKSKAIAKGRTLLERLTGKPDGA